MQESYLGMTLPGRPPRPLFDRWVAPSGFLPLNAGILFGITLPGRPPDAYSVAGLLPPASFPQMQESYSVMTLPGRHIREAGGASFCMQAVLGAYPPAHTLQGSELWN